MDSEFKEYRRNKPQQRLYKPGGGPLRRSSYGSEAKMDVNDLRNGSSCRYHSSYGSQTSLNDENLSGSHHARNRKPEQQLYVPKSGDSLSDNDKNHKIPGRSDSSSQYNNRKMSGKQDRHGHGGTGSHVRNNSKRDRSYTEIHNKDNSSKDVNYDRHRQISEPRSTSPTNFKDQNSLDRNRDTRSMETSAARHAQSGGKPPSGRRNSAGYANESPRPKYMINLDNIPPRFRKKYLEHSGHHSFDSVDHVNRDKQPNALSYSNYNQTQFHNPNSANWSQTLPSRGRGRLREEGIDRDKFISTYLKSYENSRRSTPSNSYLNLYDQCSLDDKNLVSTTDIKSNSIDMQSDELDLKRRFDNVSQNGISNVEGEPSTHNEDRKDDSDHLESVSHESPNLVDMTNLDWTEEVEKTLQLEDNDTSTSFSLNIKSASISEDIKQPEMHHQPKKSSRSRRRDKRSSSRGHRNSEKRTERTRKDSNVSVQQEIPPSSLRRRDRERRDSHKSNRSSNIGNSRDDLDRWRSLRSFSREQSTEGRIVSQCNSRDVSSNRAMSPKDNDGFRVPMSMPRSSNWQASNQKNNGTWVGARNASIERGRQSPAPSVVSEVGAGDGAPGAGHGGGRSGKRRSGRRRGRNSENVAPPVHVPPGSTPAPTNINWREEIKESKKHDRHMENMNHRNRHNSGISEKSQNDSASHPGLIVLPQGSLTQMHRDQGKEGSVETRKTLYDHHNPSKPIIVETSPTKHDMRLERGRADAGTRGGRGQDTSEARGARHRALLQEVGRADAVLRMRTLQGPRALADNWRDITGTRQGLQNALQTLLLSDLKYCQADNVEQNFWKILYYNFIEVLRSNLSQVSTEDKKKIIDLINTIIDEGTTFFEHLVQTLENTYKFNIEDYINESHSMPPKGLGYVGLALISVQKMYIFLGDLARYKEQVNETNNYAKSKFWYTKAQQINPKNGRPYNQLAILAIYARRKLDAVYYYMRSLMSSNPFQSARESLLSLFDENSKKYEIAEKKRRALMEALRKDNKEKAVLPARVPVPLSYREVWVRTDLTAYFTTPNLRTQQLAAMSPVELNKTFITSYLHVLGKLITRIGMETFHDSAVNMLEEFRALLNRQPLPTPHARLLQLTALNMFAVESNVRDNNKSGERSAWLDCALGMSIIMFGAMVERCCALLPEPCNTQPHTDALLLLPAIKVWSDWMICHSSVWNPPPTFDHFNLGSNNVPWDCLAKLMNILEELDDKSLELENDPKEGYVAIRLPEDSSLAGFTPLMYMEPAVAWVRGEPPYPHLVAEHALRTRKLLFFAEYLVGLEPPVLKLEYNGEASRYVSAVQRQIKDTTPQQLNEESDDGESISGVTSGPTSLTEDNDPEGADETTRKLLKRKEQLENRKATIEKRKDKMQEIIRGSWVNAKVEVRPRWLVPDTNCFIEHFPLVQIVSVGHPYVLAVPLVVVNELEGLSKCERVGEIARAALSWVISGSDSGTVKLVTSKGSVLASRAFTAESDTASPRATNDDRVLATALNLHTIVASDYESRQDAEQKGWVRQVREVVLLTSDRNLRVKTLAAELPTLDLPTFAQWAGLAEEDVPPTTEAANK